MWAYVTGNGSFQPPQGSLAAAAFRPARRADRARTAFARRPSQACLQKRGRPCTCRAAAHSSRPVPAARCGSEYPAVASHDRRDGPRDEPIRTDHSANQGGARYRHRRLFRVVEPGSIAANAAALTSCAWPAGRFPCELAPDRWAVAVAGTDRPGSGPRAGRSAGTPSQFQLC